MWNLKPLAVKDFRDHLNIAFPVDAVPEKVSKADKDELLRFYAKYEEKLGRPSAELKGEETKPTLRMNVHDAYALVQDGKRLGSLRSGIKLLAESCPYCGYGSIQELDHLLQRGEYKLFSIYPLNLVPCCGTCNRGKRKTSSEKPNEQQVHVYLEDLSGYDFLRVAVNVHPETGGLKLRYFIEQSIGMSDDVYDRLVHHLKEFDLQARYEKQANIFLGGLEYAITSSYKEGGSEALKRFLTGTAGALKTRYGPNDWRTSLMRSLSECSAFYEGGFESALGLLPTKTDHPGGE